MYPRAEARLVDNNGHLTLLAHRAGKCTPGCQKTVEPDSSAIRADFNSCADTHNRHQQAWTRLYSGGLQETHPARPWTVLDILAMLCKQGVGGSSPLSSTNTQC
jgi:hypothetical protein